MNNPSDKSDDQRVEGRESKIRGDVVLGRKISFTSATEVRQQWWHDILSRHGTPRCCAFFLFLPSDEHLMNYLINYGRELGLLAGSECLIMFQIGSDVTSQILTPLRALPMLVEYVSDGYSIEIADYFGIPLEHFPCMVIFRDIMSTAHIAVGLQGMDTAEIAAQMRNVFSIIRSATKKNEDPLMELEVQRKT